MILNITQIMMIMSRKSVVMYEIWLEDIMKKIGSNNLDDDNN